MKSKNICLLLGLALGLSGCQTDLTIPFPEHESRLTLNSFLVEDGEFFLYVTRSFGALEEVEPRDDSTLLVKDAEVSLWRDGEKLADLVFADSLRETRFFTNPLTGMVDSALFAFPATVYRPTTALPAPQVGETYEYRAFHPAYGEARAAATVIAPPRVISAVLKRDSLVSTTVEGRETRWSAIEITIEDPADEVNYYSAAYDMSFIRIFNDGGNPSPDDTTIFGERSLLVAEVTPNEFGGFSTLYRPWIDTDFNGQRHTLIGWIQLPGCCEFIGSQPRIERKLISISVQISTLDPNFGVYQEKLQLQSQTRTIGLEGALLPREPVSVVGNVEGGYGLIGSFHAVQVEVELE